MLVLPILERKELRVCKVKYCVKVSELVSGGTRLQTHAVWQQYWLLLHWAALPISLLLMTL